MGKIKITQVKSVIDRSAKQKKTMTALGLKRIRHSIEVEETPQIKGMLQKVSHLVEVEPAS